MKKFLPKKLINTIKRIIPNRKNKLLKKLKFINSDKVICLGSDYGGWSFLDGKNLENKFIISAGLGEDASFDIEIKNKFNCKVICIDPTPRAIEHYNQIIDNSGNPRSNIYQEGGKQNISSYDLTKINKDNFILIKNALYNNDNKQLKFFAPKNKNHVSHSISDWQNDYKKTSDFIKVNTITIKSILKQYDIQDLEILKLDIEGAEVEVIKNILSEKIFPNQILVEFDELNKINELAISRFEEVHQLLLSKNYKLIKTTNNFPDFLYSRSIDSIKY